MDPELRVGAARVTHTGVHYDGGYSTEGIFAYAADPLTCWVTGTEPDQPDAVWNFTWQQADWVDHAGMATTTVEWVVTPPLPGKQLEMNVNLLEVTIEEDVPIVGSSQQGHVAIQNVCGTSLIRGSRFARNPSAAGEFLSRGGFVLTVPTQGTLQPTFLFEDSTFSDNVAGWGAAVYVDYGQYDLRFRRCLFRCAAIAT